MRTPRLNDAAIALSCILTQAGVKFGIFGGFAILCLGGVRESKDVDCIASITKPQILELLNDRDGFSALPQTRQDYVAFIWSTFANESIGDSVLVEVFCADFPGEWTIIPNSSDIEWLTVYLGSQYSMSAVQLFNTEIQGEHLGKGSTYVLDPSFIFEGKLSAAALRDKFHDAADLRWLEAHYPQLNMICIGLVLKTHPEMHWLFERIGVDVEKAKNRAEGVSVPGAGGIGAVQKGLLE